MISIYNRFNDIVVRAFSKDTKFIKSLDNACRHFVNNNPIATPKPRSPCRTPELLARYADGFLKSNSKDNEMNADNLMIVFKFIAERDSFEEHYRRLLAKRLVNGTSKSEEMEESVIHRLQEENSIEYTSKMTKMFTDIKASDDLKIKFKDGMNVLFDFSPMVLARSTWPFHSSQDYNDLKLAPELKVTIDSFKAMYLQQGKGKQIEWLWNHGRAELKAHLTKGKGGKPFNFIVSQIQLMVLLAYNYSKTYTLDDLVKIVGIKKELLQNHVTPFVKYKLLKEEGDQLVIVDHYPSKKNKVSFIGAITKTKEEDVEEITKEVQQSRTIFLEASIVRIMKLKKLMAPNNLLNEVVVQAGNRFNAKNIDVKRAIDSLIDKEYLKRNGDDYEYIS